MLMKTANARRVLFASAMAAIALFAASSWFMRGQTSISPDLADALRGALAGFGIGLMIVYLVATRRARNPQR